MSLSSLAALLLALGAAPQPAGAVSCPPSITVLHTPDAAAAPGRPAPGKATHSLAGYGLYSGPVADNASLVPDAGTPVQDRWALPAAPEGYAVACLYDGTEAKMEFPLAPAVRSCTARYRLKPDRRRGAPRDIVCR